MSRLGEGRQRVVGRRQHRQRHDATRDCSESAHEVSTTGTLAPGTRLARGHREPAGHVAQATYDSDSALAMSERLAAEAVILGVGMVGMEGYEIARHVRRRQSQTRLIALTG